MGLGFPGLVQDLGSREWEGCLELKRYRSVHLDSCCTTS